jgi:hypothetical protein
VTGLQRVYYRHINCKDIPVFPLPRKDAISKNIKNSLPSLTNLYSHELQIINSSSVPSVKLATAVWSTILLLRDMAVQQRVIGFQLFDEIESLHFQCGYSQNSTSFQIKALLSFDTTETRLNRDAMSYF